MKTKSQIVGELLKDGKNPLVTLCGTTTTNGSTDAFTTLTNN